MNGFKGNCWPTQKQDLLLRAALFTGSEALEAWDRWKDGLNIQEIDSASFRLLPLLYRNLHTIRVQDPLLQTIKGVYRHTWSKNQMLMRALSPMLAVFHEANIDTLVLKGAALLKLYYEDYGMRPMNDLDLLIPERRATQAIELLSQAGYAPVFTPRVSFSERYLPLIHAYGFSKSGKIELDLHWHVLQECRRPDSDHNFWQDSIAIDFYGMPTRALNPADQLLHILVHGLKWDIVPPIRWIADAITLLRKTPDFEWDRFVNQTLKRRLLLPVKQALEFLGDRFEIPIPTNVLEEMRQTRASLSERIEQSYRMKDHHRQPLGHLPLLWFSYLRSSDNLSTYRKLVGFMDYLKQFWGVQTAWQLPLKALPRAIRRFRRINEKR